MILKINSDLEILIKEVKIIFIYLKKRPRINKKSIINKKLYLNKV